jgi:bifunctional non-homologous end joining protein LigD
MKMRVGKHDVEITHPEKPLFPQGITKRDFVEYYARIAPVMLPHVIGRPITMHRFVHGVGAAAESPSSLKASTRHHAIALHATADGFYHKNVPDYFPSWIDTVTVTKQDGEPITYAVINNAATLVYLANFGCITPHIWLSQAPKLEYPDIMVFDLDPGQKDFKFVCTVARRLKKLLEKAKLVPFVKTSGSKGLHVTVPIKATHDFDAVRAVARTFAQQLVHEDPENITLEMSLEKRQGRLFVDILRNALGQTVAAPYSVRPQPSAPVATPVEWHELAKLSSSQHYTIKNIFRRLSRKQDPWRDMYKHARRLKV